MIPYELIVLFRVMPKPELTTAIKRTANAIFDRGGLIRKLENLGTRETPYKISSNGMPHRQASYFLYECNIPPSKIGDIINEYSRDVDIIKKDIYKKTIPEQFECTLHEEMQPPPYRKDVQEIMALARRKEKRKFKANTGMDYYPFQK
ncbi:unnamed protein product [Phyllotreta striolata]|uniref:Small ribosomal subunit protein bS6m n=1 Tax=Phyllotreta striolata TaxID=444603 RepID=A0A9N9TL83_PHYSR|nr:unnamed protein product [Phyllotreta striolata]